MALNSEDGPKVLVIGAGPVGLTMACELARHGVRCRIVDASPGPTEESRALGIQARTLEVFANVGVVDAVLSRARKVHGVGAFADGRQIAHITLDMEGLETPYPYLLVLPQSETERILVDRLQSHGIEVERLTKLTEIAPDSQGVIATLVDAEGRSSEARADWLIGCDGSRSVIRKGLKLPFEGIDYEESFLLADVRLDWDRPDDEMTILLTPEGPVIGFPLPSEGHTRLVYASTGSVEESDSEPGRVVSWFQATLRGNGRPEAVVSDPGWTSAFKIHRRVAGRFREGRCFIAGDAAHIHSPAGGQGMNTGIQDAYNLAWKLALVVRGASPDSLLDSYSPERRSVVAGVLRGTDLLTRVVTLRSEVARTLRNHLFRLLGEFDFVARKLSKNASELGVEYHDSPIVHEDQGEGLISGLGDRLDFRAGPHPGDRVPDVPLEHSPGQAEPTRLFEILRGTKHVLLIFEGSHGGPDLGSIEALSQIARRHAEHVDAWFVPRSESPAREIAGNWPTIPDHEGEWHRRFGARGPCLYLIRPDGYLGYRSMPPEAEKLANYLRRIFLA